jgi:hypothetical protein
MSGEIAGSGSPSSPTGQNLCAETLLACRTRLQRPEHFRADRKRSTRSGPLFKRVFDASVCFHPRRSPSTPSPRIRPPSTRIMLPVMYPPHIARPSDANARANLGMPGRSSARWSMYRAGDIGGLLRFARCTNIPARTCVSWPAGNPTQKASGRTLARP